MRARTGRWRAATVVALGVTAVALGGCSQPAQTAAGPVSPPGSVSWPAVEQALGTPTKTGEQGVHSAEFPRDDLRVSTEGVALSPGMELVTEARWLPTEAGRALVLGEMTVTAGEQQAVLDQLDRGGLEVTAIHKHLPPHTPELWWVHFAGYGDAVAEAAALHAALGATATPPPPEAEEEASAPGLNTALLDRTFGVRGELEDGVYHLNVAVPTPITDTRANRALPPAMEASSLLMFQPLAPGQSAINGDLALTPDQVNAAAAALRARGIQVLSVHNHLTHEQPRLLYLHYWATGDTGALATSLKTALEQAQAS